MNKLTGLISSLYSEDVTHCRLGDVCTHKSGSTITKKDTVVGKVPVIGGGRQPAYYHNKSNREAGTIAVSGSGVYAGFVSYWDIPVYLSDSFSLHPYEILNKKYLYYFLKEKQHVIHRYKKGSGVPHVYGTDLMNLSIQIPSIEVQKEIVNILDKFTTLEAELEAELEARKVQYGFYLNKILLEQDITYEHFTLNKLCCKTNTVEWDDGSVYDYVDLSSVPIGINSIVETRKINSQNAPSRARYEIKTDDVLFATTRPMQKRICIVPPEFDNQVCSTGYCVLRADRNIILPEYLYFNLQGDRFYQYIETVQSGATYPSVSNTRVKDYKIPVPPIDNQICIVETLLNFENIVNNISIGLPAEIEARRKQYEYYRNKLLTFEESES